MLLFFFLPGWRSRFRIRRCWRGSCTHVLSWWWTRRRPRSEACRMLSGSSNKPMNSREMRRGEKGQHGMTSFKSVMIWHNQCNIYYLDFFYTQGLPVFKYHYKNWAWGNVGCLVLPWSIDTDLSVALGDVSQIFTVYLTYLLFNPYDIRLQDIQKKKNLDLLFGL